MPEYIVTENQFKKISKSISFNEDFKLAEKNWSLFSNEEKNYIVETLIVFYPSKKKFIRESKWYNTLGDIVGIFDPTGVVDLVNGISYIRQGDKLFGFLSLISAVPLLGDIVAKPMMSALKVGAPAAKDISKVMKLVEVGKTAEATQTLKTLTDTGGITGKFVQGVGKVGGKLKGYLNRVPMPLLGGFKKTIIQWIELFEKAAKSGTALRSKGQGIVQGMKGIEAGTGGLLKLSKDSQIKQLNSLIDMAKSTPGVFSGYRTDKGLMSWKTIFGGMPQLIGRNKSVRALMRQTKWWLGFLDYVGIGNFVGPEELSEQMGENDFMKKMEEYQKTGQAQSNFRQDFGGEQQVNQTAPQPQKSENSKQDPLASFFNKLLTNSLNPLPGV